MKRRSLIPRVANCWGWFLMAAWGVMALSGCLVIPVDYYSLGSRHNISAKTQSLMQPGVTTKEEVVLILGEPDYASDDGQRFDYAWRKVKWVIFFGLSEGVREKNYLLQIMFDSDNRVVDVVLTDAWNPITAQGHR